MHSLNEREASLLNRPYNENHVHSRAVRMCLRLQLIKNFLGLRNVGFSLGTRLAVDSVGQF